MNTSEEYEQIRERYNKAIRDFRQKRMEMGLCQACKRPVMPGKTHCQIHLKQRSDAETKRNRTLKDEVMAHYGNKCSCCNESTRELLTLDHINNDGIKWRKLLKGALTNNKMVYKDIQNRNYPEDIQVLCFSCNIGKSWYGTCPHKFTRI